MALQQGVPIAGVVVDAVTGTPVARATVTLQPAQTGSQAHPALSNERGEFVFRDIPAGAYSMTAARNGYVHGGYGRRGPNGPEIPFVVDPAHPPEPVRMQLTPASAISGRIIDPQGSPYPYVQVQALKVAYRESVRTLDVVSIVSTNDLGEYRLWNLPPGQYVISAQAGLIRATILPAMRSSAPPLPGAIIVDPAARLVLTSSQDPANAGQLRQALEGSRRATAYYRNAANGLAATVIDLRPGADVGGIDFIAGAVQTVPVTIKAPEAGANLRLSILPYLQGTLTINNSLPTPPAFEMAPGSYTIAAVGTDSANRPVAGYAAVTVNPLNPATVSIPMFPSSEVSGSLAVEGGSADNSVALRFRRVPPGGLADPATLSIRGAFNVKEGFLEGAYTVEATGLENVSSGAFVKSVTVGGTTLEDNTFHAGRDPIQDMEILIGTRGARIEGTAFGTNGEALSNVAVVLVPERRGLIGLYKSSFTDAAGKYFFEGVAPGMYKVFSWEDVEPGNWFNPDFLRAFEDSGSVVEARESDRIRADVPVHPLR